MAQEVNNQNENRNEKPSAIRVISGIIMIVIYIGMGVLLLTHFFDATLPIQWIRIVLAVAFILYGIWRGYRQFSGRFDS